MAKAYLVGSGIASLAAAAFLIREGGFSGNDIVVLEEQDREGGSLDAAGSPESGYTMRGGRMFEIHFECTYDLLSSVPSLDDPDRSVTEDTFAFHDEFAWDDHARLVGADGSIIDAHSMTFSERDRLELVKCVATPERLLDGKRISDLFHEGFFASNFWAMWCTTFAFEPWHSAIEFRRYLNRFVHLFKTFDTMSGIYRTRFNQFDSIVRPLLAWLTGQGVTVQLGTRVTDLHLAGGDALTVEALVWERGGKSGRTAVGPDDLVMVTNGSMTANSTLGSTDAVPALDTASSSGAWQLWETLAAKRPGRLGDPRVFDSHVDESTWVSFTVTTRDPLFFKLMEEFSGSEAGKGGLITFKDSSWLLTIVLNHQPHFRDQPEDAFVWWGYALFPDREGDFVGKSMAECTGREILDEVLQHLPFTERQRILDGSLVIPAKMPYITSQFLVRRVGDRPQVVPDGSTNLAFIGQYAEVPDDVVFTVEYSVRTAWTAVAQLLGLDRQPPPVYKGRHEPRILVEALQTLHRR
ncbi:oleate hydratase [Streptomyces lavendulae]|uniref:oleate hydratase n=1 Tax=Streptomyces lavendulae TaxID=1914 RepID=UPI0024A38A17|nr:oleate hydratase [Streptomyces lavendulae]GLX24129.1 oleate hydratase [Streptomyces lavendulae subsp. lavendulae]GLX30148.1 oleate hydratase [Streptomyces lavendulae subsp. lavendulae]